MFRWLLRNALRRRFFGLSLLPSLLAWQRRQVPDSFHIISAGIVAGAPATSTTTTSTPGRWIKLGLASCSWQWFDSDAKESTCVQGKPSKESEFHKPVPCCLDRRSLLRLWEVFRPLPLPALEAVELTWLVTRMGQWHMGQWLCDMPVDWSRCLKIEEYWSLDLCRLVMACGMLVNFTLQILPQESDLKSLNTEHSLSSCSVPYGLSTCTGPMSGVWGTASVTGILEVSYDPSAYPSGTAAENAELQERNWREPRWKGGKYRQLKVFEIIPREFQEMIMR